VMGQLWRQTLTPSWRQTITPSGSTECTMSSCGMRWVWTL
jgi:hypothetical protein